VTSGSLPLSLAGRECISPSLAELYKLKDEQLMECVQGGQTEGLSLLFKRYFRLVLGVSLNILRDRGEAEDLMQEVFLEIYRKPHLFDAKKGSVRTWILQYAYHRSFDRRQYLSVRKFYNSHIDPSDLGELEPYYSPNGWDGLTYEERNEMLQKAMLRLTEKQKQVLQLAYFEGLLMNEIAERIGETYERTRGYYYRGLSKLRHVLHEPFHEQRPEVCKSSGAAD
jgi:RNA polymerase sigma-70 factor (ECF subfamily)